MPLIVPPIVEPENEVLDNGEEEEQFLNAILKGDINTFMDLLNRKEEIYLNLECKDTNGKSALRIAISEGYSVIVDQLLMQDIHVGDALLRAVDVGYIETVKKICEFAMKLTSLEDRQSILDCHCEDDDFHPDVTPIVLAAQRNDFSMIKTLLNSGTTIVNITSKNFTTKATDSLQKSVGTLEIYRGLASEAYITLANGDPVDRAFVMSHTLKKLSQTDVEFKSNYLELANTIDQVGTDIISHARTTEEIMTVLTHYEPGDNTTSADCRSLGPLPKLTRAIDFDQRKFVAHPNCQQVVRTIFYGRLAYLRDKSSLYRFMFFLAIVFSFPFMSLTCLYFPTKWVKSTIGCPYVKFMIQLASDLFFVFLLFADTISNRGEVGTFDPLQTPTKGLILLYVLGIGWREVKSVARFGKSVFVQSRHLRDISLVTLFLSSFLFGIAQRYYDQAMASNQEITNVEKRSLLMPAVQLPTETIPLSLDLESNFTEEDSVIELQANDTLASLLTIHRIANIPLSKAARAARPKVGGGGNKQDGSTPQRNITNVDYLNFILLEWWEPGIMATSLFACSTVITFLRLFPYVVLSDVTGPLQISVGSMIHGTVHFFWVVGVVTVAFAVGITYIYAFYEEQEISSKICLEINMQMDCRKGTLANVMYSIIYLYWSTFGLESLDPLKLPGQAMILEIAGRVLYGMFYVFVVVVLLNALIAVMSNVYNEVEENGDVEWKFASTAMWLGVLQDNEVVPPPFNLLPSTEDIRWVLNMMYSKCWYFLHKHVGRPDSSDYAPPKVQRNKKFKRSDRSQYRRVMSHLVERYVASKTAADVSVEADISIADIRALRNDLLSLKFEMFQKFFDTVEDINRTIGDGYHIFKTSKEANELFQRTEAIHSKVGTQLQTVLDFQDTLSAKIKEMQEHEEPVIDTRSIGFQVNLIQIPPKVSFMDVSIQTSPGYWSCDNESQTLAPEVQDTEIQTDVNDYLEVSIQTEDVVLEDIESQTDPPVVNEKAIQTVPLPLKESFCQTCPPPATKSHSQQTEQFLQDLSCQTDPPPPLPAVFDSFSQVTPPPSPPAFKNRSTQTAERRVISPQQVPWRPFANATSPTSNSSFPTFNNRRTSVSSTSSLNSRRSSSSSVNSDSESSSVAKSRFKAAVKKNAILNKKK